jgi:Icc-related predicted phosphoesterase
MIALLGDIHGNIAALRYKINQARGADALIQVGDFGLFQKNGIDEGFRRACADSPMPIYFIDGNHDDCKRWTEYTEVTRLWEDSNLFYIPRGTVMNFGDRTFAFMGGAGSIDKGTRLRMNWFWDDKEDISPQEALRLLDNAAGKQIDVFITHCPPISVVESNFNPMDKIQFGVSPDWKDHNMDVIEDLWRALKHPKIYSGHMHRSVVEENYRILNIDELVEI